MALCDFIFQITDSLSNYEKKKKKHKFDQGLRVSAKTTFIEKCTRSSIIRK